MTFDQYYQHYLSLHQNKHCRRLHFVGQIVTIFFVAYSALNNLWLLPLAPFVIYLVVIYTTLSASFSSSE